MPVSRMFHAAVLSTIFLAQAAIADNASLNEGSPIAHAAWRGHDIPVYRIGELEAANTPQGMDGFAIRVARVLHAWTRDHAAEATGNLCRTADGTRWGAVLLTIHAHAVSPLTDACPAGMENTGTTITSRLQRQHFRASATDRLFLPPALAHADAIATRPDSFSADVYARPGYLVGRFWLHFQDGKGLGRRVWNMRKNQPATGSQRHADIAACLGRLNAADAGCAAGIPGVPRADLHALT